MTTTLVPATPRVGGGQTTFAALAAREMRRFVLNPLFLAAAALTAFFLWSEQRSTITAIEDVNAIAATLFGGLGMMAAFWLTRSMRAPANRSSPSPRPVPARTPPPCARPRSCQSAAAA